MILAVTAFVPIPGHPRPMHEYLVLAKPLHELAHEAPLLASSMEVEECWLYHYLREFYGDTDITWSVADNPEKNSVAYHVVQAQKTEFLRMAARACDMVPDVYVWIDYGIFHVPGVTGDIIKEFLGRAAEEKAIAIPGCWEKQHDHDDEYPNWRFAGGTFIVPRQYVEALDGAMKREYVRRLREHKHVTWEVNCLASIEQSGELPIWWYKADHDASMFTNYRQSMFADRSEGRRISPTAFC